MSTVSSTYDSAHEIVLWGLHSGDMLTRKWWGIELFFNKVLWPLRHAILVAGYIQKLDMPHFGSDKPGDTYY